MNCLRCVVFILTRFNTASRSSSEGSRRTKARRRVGSSIRHLQIQDACEFAEAALRLIRTTQSFFNRLLGQDTADDVSMDVR